MFSRETIPVSKDELFSLQDGPLTNSLGYMIFPVTWGSVGVGLSTILPSIPALRSLYRHVLGAKPKKSSYLNTDRMREKAYPWQRSSPEIEGHRIYLECVQEVSTELGDYNKATGRAGGGGVGHEWRCEM